MSALFYGDNLDILRRYITDASIDLVYLDPPFNSNANYNVLFAERDGTRAAAQIKAFEDTWRWDQGAALAYQNTVEVGGTVSLAMQAFRTFLGENDVLAYLSMMAPRLVELRRVMKETASIYLHCDPTASHYLKMLMDAVFGPANFRNEIIWRRTGAHGPRRSFGPIHDTILFYSKSPAYFFQVLKRPYMRGHVETRYTQEPDGRLKFTSGGNVLTGPGATEGESGQVWQGFDPSAKNRHWAVPGFLTDQMPPEFEDLGVLAKLDALYAAGFIDIIEGAAWPTPVRYLEADDGHPMQDMWAYQPYTEATVYGIDDGIDADVQWLGPTAPERLGYQTQKPLGLLDRIIRSSCPEDGIVLDPFCGCGTTIAAAQAVKRNWLGIDITHLAIGLIRHRLLDTYGDDIRATYEVIGEPVSPPDAEALAASDPYQFQAWALGLIGARPFGNIKKGADKGIDGRLYFHEGDGGDTKQVIISVKAGKLHAPYVRDLRGVVEREKAAIGVLLALSEPTKAMKTEAASAGFYVSSWWDKKYPKLQIITIAELFGGTRIEMPPIRQTNVTFKRAPKHTKREKQARIHWDEFEKRFPSNDE